MLLFKPMSERLDGAGWGWGRVGGVLGMGRGRKGGLGVGREKKLVSM